MVRLSGLKPGMTVLDLSSGSGYNIDVFAAAVGPDGKVYAHNTRYGLELRDGASLKAMQARLAGNRLPNVVFWTKEFSDLGLTAEVDLAYSGLNLHDYYGLVGKDQTIELLRSIRRTLKPDGRLTVVDHQGDPGRDNVTLHRIEEELAREMIEMAGFRIEADSRFLANPKDDRTLVVFNKAVAGKTDRFLFIARKNGS